MHKHILLFLLFLLPLALSAQLTIQVTGIPANTPENEKIYVTGNFNDWNAADARYILTPTSPGQYSVTLHPAPGRIEYKFTRGGWPSVEGNASGKYQANHTADYSGQPQTVQVKILGWEDRSAGGGGSAAPNVFVLNQQFYMPQLKRNRRVWVYLPPDYATSNKRYPVLYLHDAQNLFDNQTSSFGEWQVDEALNKLFNQGDYGCIAIGIDNGGAKRLEVSPTVGTVQGHERTGRQEREDAGRQQRERPHGGRPRPFAMHGGEKNPARFGFDPIQPNHPHHVAIRRFDRRRGLWRRGQRRGDGRIKRANRRPKLVL